MKSISFLACCVIIASVSQASCGVPAQAKRGIPKPLPSHPGNVFLAGEEVTVSTPPGTSETWRAVDYEGKVIAEGRAGEGQAKLGHLPVGYYELQRGSEGATNRVSIGVLASLEIPIPATSPVALDVAMAWFYKEPQMAAVASLCALAGINWVRDRLNWAEMEPQKGRFGPENRYDHSARAQYSAGLNVLQVNHISPGWANPVTRRFPLDLRNAHHFYQEMARRWQEIVPAFEPWNEPDIEMFGGHTGSEIASMQKAAYLGLKAGNPKVIASQNVFALHNRAQLEDFHQNRAWPYFDTFNLHHYAPTDSYPGIYADFRAVSAGKPFWVTECNVPVKWSGDEKLKEPSDADLRVQAERVGKIFAASLHEGSAMVFYFQLPHYVEGKTQFGIVRPDLTPRPAYVALAAVGRLLSDAKPLGRWKSPNPELRRYWLQAKPAGQVRDILVIWSTNNPTPCLLPATPIAVFDHLGRQLPKPSHELRITSAPVYVLFAKNALSESFVRRVIDPIQIEPPPKPSLLLSGKPSPVVLQAMWPTERVDLKNSAYRLVIDKREIIPICVYNFSTRAVQGALRVVPPKSWQATLINAAETQGLRTTAIETVTLQPGDRVQLGLAVEPFGQMQSKAVESIRLEGDFGQDDKPVLALQIVAQ
jgi:hypothetical protein